MAVFKRWRTQGGGWVGWSGGFGQLRHMDLYLAADRIFYLLILLVFFLKGSRCRTPPWISPTLVGQKNVGKGVPAPLSGSVIYCDIFGGSSKSYCDSELLVPRGQGFRYKKCSTPSAPKSVVFCFSQRCILCRLRTNLFPLFDQLFKKFCRYLSF